jgi:3-oxoacyl-[acyl-carrier protein] reductase
MPRTVLVTGASRGLGLAICDRLLRDGYRVVGLSRRLSDGYGALVARYPDQAAFHPADLAEVDDIPSLARQLIHTHGPVWGLVNNAGIGNDGVLATMHQSEIDRVIRVNILAPIVLTKYVSRTMLARREGRIVNVSSIIASTGFSGLSVYAASKAGLEGFTRSLSRELGKRGITVNCVAPGYMETEMTQGLQGEKLEGIRRRAPLGLPLPEDAAGAVAYLLGDDGARVTGRIMTVDGGSTA